ncbi:hypothetical protein [Paraburkholderia sp. JHI869]|uniref:hypothetical protein n=1 Tax=Paraburkholderia sp. JHI869 TaxID=3112959 RepID=UPI003181BF24
MSQVYAHTAGGGKLLAVLQVNKQSAFDDGRARQAAIIALGVYSELKHAILVDADVDPFDTDDVMWAMRDEFVRAKFKEVDPRPFAPTLFGDDHE